LGSRKRTRASERAAEAGQRLVCLEGERDELAWAMGVLERGWSGPDPDGPPPGAPGPVVIELRLPEEDE
jgi:hypothetical protein